MFYSQLVLAKKGPLGKVWLAAHWDRKLTKMQINSTDISKSVDSIMQPQFPFALRMSGHLLLGVVRIYSRKVKYLLSDCTDALIKIKMAFRPGMVDLPPDANVAAINSITLPENNADINMNVPFGDDITLEPFGDEVFELNTVLREKITLDERPRTPPRRESEMGEEYADVLDQQFGDDMDDMFVGQKTPVKTPEQLREQQRGLGDTPIPGFTTPGDGDQGGFDGGFDLPVEDIMTPVRPPGSSQSTPFTIPGSGMRETPNVNVNPLVDDFGDIELQIRGRSPEDEVTRVEKRPRPPTVDRHTELSNRVIKEQLNNTGPITRGMVLAPISKKALLQRARDRDVHTLYRITNVEGLGGELLNLFAISMVDGPQEVRSPEERRKQQQAGQDTPFTPASPLATGDEQDAEPQGGFEFNPPLSPDQAQPFISTSPVNEFLGPDPTGIDDGEEINTPLKVSETEEPWSERTKKMHVFLNKTFKDDNTISYLNLVKGKKAHTVAGTFYELLVLKSRNYIELDQDEPYSDIRVRKTDHFDDPLPQQD